MHYLLDTGILLRLVNRADVLHPQIRSAIRMLRSQQHTLCTALQNVAEFWNVCTRPAAARGGLGMSVEDSAHRLRLIERGVVILTDTADTYATWKNLVISHAVKGVQVHDARIAALMTSHSITHLVTLNAADFARYPGITPVTPSEVLSVAAP